MADPLENALAKLKHAMEQGPLPERPFDPAEIAGLALTRAEHKEEDPTLQAVMEAAKEWMGSDVSSADRDLVREEVRRRLALQRAH
jgi:hypothetical protein